MSTIDTNPEVNSSVVEINPGQIRVIRPVTHFIDTDYGQDMKQVTPYSRIPNPTPLTWSSLTTISRMFKSLDWPIDGESMVDTIELTIENILKYTVPLTPPAAAFNFDSITFTISKNTNAMFQGKLILAYDPTSDADYYTKFSMDIKKPQYLTQLNYVEFDPRDSESISITIDNFLPFDFLRLRNASNPGTIGLSKRAAQQFSYVKSYSLGRIYIFPFNSLKTKSSVTSIPVQLEAKLNNYRYSGRRFYNYTQ